MDHIERFIANIIEKEGPSLSQSELDKVQHLHKEASVFNTVKREKAEQRALLEPSLNALWNQQVAKLLKIKVHQKLGMSEEEYRASLPQFTAENLENLSADDIEKMRPYLVETRLTQAELFRMAEVDIDDSAINYVTHDFEFNSSDFPYSKQGLNDVVKVLETNQNFQTRTDKPYIIWNLAPQLTAHDVIKHLREDQKPYTLGTIFLLENKMKEASIRSVEALNWIIQTSEMGISAITDIYLFHRSVDNGWTSSSDALLITQRPIENGENRTQPLRLVNKYGYSPY